MSRRTDQIASTLHRAVQEVLGRGLNDPRIRGLVTVTGVSVSDDLKSATILVSVYPEQRQELTMHGLADAARHVRREVGEVVAMRQVPDLVFKLDVSLKKQAGVFEALARIARENEARRDAGFTAAPPRETPEEGKKGGGE